MSLENKSIHLETTWDSAERKVITSSAECRLSGSLALAGHLQDAIRIPVSSGNASLAEVFHQCLSFVDGDIFNGKQILTCKRLSRGEGHDLRSFEHQTVGGKPNGSAVVLRSIGHWKPEDPLPVIVEIPQWGPWCDNQGQDNPMSMEGEDTKTGEMKGSRGANIAYTVYLWSGREVHQVLTMH